jgi:hypothetical protein
MTKGSQSSKQPWAVAKASLCHPEPALPVGRARGILLNLIVPISPVDFSFVEMTNGSQSSKQPWAVAKAFRYPAFPNAGAWFNKWSVMTQTMVEGFLLRRNDKGKPIQQTTLGGGEGFPLSCVSERRSLVQ